MQILKNFSFVFLIGLMFLLPYSSQAGIEKNTYMIGGTTNLQNITFFDNSSTGGGGTVTDFSFSPFYGWFFRKNLAAGPVFSYSHLNHDLFRQADTETEVGIFGRLYTGVNLFFEVSLRYNRRSDSEGFITRGGYTGPAMGYSIMLGDNVALEPRAFVDFGFGRDLSDIVTTGLTIGVFAFLPSSRMEEENDVQE